MITITRDDLKSLAARRTSPCVSIYMPLHESQPDSNQDAIRLKNLLKKAHDILLDGGRRRSDVDEILAEAAGLETDSMFWRRDGRRGLAALIEPGALRVLRSYQPFDEFVAVGEGFHVTPLVQALSEPEQFMVLALSANGVRFYRADAHSLTAVPLPESIPKNLHESTAGMQFDTGVQSHTSSTHGLGAGRSGVLTGKGAGKDDYKTLLTEYLRIVSRHLDPMLRHESVPLVVAAVDYIHPIFRDLCSYRHLTEKGVLASPENLREAELHRLALEVAAPNLRPKMRSDHKRYEQLQTTDRIAFQIETVLPAADRGRVEVLFAARGAHIWGRGDGENEIQVHRKPEPGDGDLLDAAVAKTIAHGGVVHFVDANDVPSRGPVAAIVRATA